MIRHEASLGEKIMDICVQLAKHCTHYCSTVLWHALNVL